MEKFKTPLLVTLVTTTSVAFAHFIASFTNPAASPFNAIGSLVINLTPTPLKTFAVDNFGTKDKPILLTSIALTVLLLAFLTSFFARNNKKILFGVVGGLASLPLIITLFTFPITFSNLIPSISLLLGAGVLMLLFFWEKSLIVEQESKELSRRGFLTAASALGVMTVAGGLVGNSIINAREKLSNIKLPNPVNFLKKPESGLETEVKGITPLVTPQKDLYRVDVNLAVPIVDHETWSLTIKRDGYKDVVYSYEDILQMDLVERDITLVCVSNSVGGEYNGSGRWLGVPLKKLLEPFAYNDGKIDQLFSTSTDGYTSSTSIDRINDQALIAVGYNGEVLSRTHGFPARLLVPGIYGYVGATKWLKTLELTNFSEKEAYWTERGWAKDAPIKPTTRIDTPNSFSTMSKDFTVAGVAYAPTRGIDSVQVQIDGGSWRNAMVGKRVNISDEKDYWVQWQLPVTLETGSHTVSARCITLDGETQTPVRAEPFPSGASGIQSLNFTVA